MPIGVAKLEIRRNLTGEHICRPKKKKTRARRQSGLTAGEQCAVYAGALDLPGLVQLCSRCREEGHNMCLC
jgi:hypothetical protein